MASVASEKGPLPEPPQTAHEASIRARAATTSYSSGVESSNSFNSGSRNELRRRYTLSPDTKIAVQGTPVPNRRFSDHITGINKSTSDVRLRNEWPPHVGLEESKSCTSESFVTTNRIGQSIRKLSKYYVRDNKEYDAATSSRNRFEAVIFVPEKSSVFRSTWVYDKTISCGTFKTFSEAEQACLAFAPPEKQDSTREVTNCAVCHQACGFIKKRKKTCKNCGRWVCPQCSTRKWLRTMLPHTYVLDRSDPMVRICDTCYDTGGNFRQALLQGDESLCKQFHRMGCINLRTPYAIYQNERPVHCAAHGGNLKILKWLIEDLHCPIFTDAEKKVALGDGMQRSVLGIAARQGHLAIMRYLLFVHNCDIQEVTELPALWRTINALFEEEKSRRTDTPQRTDTTPDHMVEPFALAIPCSDMAFHTPESSSYAGGIVDVVPSAPLVTEEPTVPFSEENTCAICFENTRNCTLVPCGHFACCYECGQSLTECCICRQRINSVIRTFST